MCVINLYQNVLPRYIKEDILWQLHTLYICTSNNLPNTLVNMVFTRTVLLIYNVSNPTYN